jgi:drug/metabolite transporter (DMT)-like permease
VNLIRLAIALPLLSVWIWITTGSPYPAEASSDAWLWLSLSGLVGFVIGDMCLFRAFVVLGPRLSSLIMATAPLMTGLIGFGILGETLGPVALFGMALTIGGVVWALLDRKTLPRADRSNLGLGVLLALGGALGQAGGLVLSKWYPEYGENALLLAFTETTTRAQIDTLVATLSAIPATHSVA